MEEGKKMDYRIAICDDRQEDREYVRQLTAHWAQQRGNQVEMTEFCSAEQFLFSCPQPDFDLLLLDIEMGEMDGSSAEPMPTASSRKYGKYSRTSSGKFRLSVATERQTGTRVHDRMRHGHGFDLHIRPAPGNGRTEAGIRSCPGSAGKFRSRVAAPDRIVRVVASGSG